MIARSIPTPTLRLRPGAIIRIRGWSSSFSFFSTSEIYTAPPNTAFGA